MISTIESTVALPTEAAPLTSYERYYALGPDGIVIGVYANHDAKDRREILQFCETLDERPFPCPIGQGGLRLAKAGESVWISDFKDLPGMSGGGCGQITVEYETANKRFLRVECSGPH